MALEGIKIGVVAGGVSEERDISLLSGQEVFSALRESKISASLIDLQRSDPKEIKSIIRREGIDLAFIALHGSFGEDGQIQRIFQDLCLTYTGSGPQASQLAMDKLASKERFESFGIPAPNFKLFTGPVARYNGIRLPVVVKPCSSGSSFGVSIVREGKNITKAFKEAFKFSSAVLAEEYIEGKEVSVGILEDKALAVVEIIPKTDFFNFKNKYTKGSCSYIAPAKLNPGTYRHIQQAALAAHNCLGCRGFSRVDIRLKNDLPYILEVNSIPGLTAQSLLPLSAAVCGIEFREMICIILESAFKRENRTLR